MDEKLDSEFQFLVPEYQNALLLLQERHNIRIRPLRQLTGGRTGALLYLVSVSSPNSSIEHFVLKLDRPARWGSEWHNEAERHRLAAKLAPPAFTQDHMTSLAYDPVEAEEALAVLYTIAGESLQQCRPLVSYTRQDRLEQIFSRLSSGLLEEWNNGRIEPAPNIHPQSVLEEWLGYRLSPEQGRIHAFLSEECDFDADSVGLICRGEILPNPYAFVRGQERWGTTRQLDVLRGFIHGDLNTNNVLIEFSQYGEDLEGYYLIDFANFKENSFLLYDHAYLELSHLLQQTLHVSFEKWKEFITVLAEDEVPKKKRVPTELAGACTVISSMRQAIDTWISQSHPTLRDDLWGLYRLAAVAVGLNFCNKIGLSREERFAAFVYAAIHLQTYSLCFDAPLPASAEELALTKEQIPMEAGSTWEPFLEACHNFDRERVQILVAGPDLRDVAPLMSPLGRAEWSLVLDFDPDTETGGLYENLREEIEGRRALHLITYDTQVSLNPARATYWYVARGLRGRASTFPAGDSWLAWKLKYSTPLGKFLRDLAASSGEQPGTCVILWNEPNYVGKICDLITDAFGDRIEFIFATPHLASLLDISEAYKGKNFPLQATQIAAGLSKLLRRFYLEKKRVFMPAADGKQMALKRSDVNFLEEEMTLVHLDIGMREEAEGRTRPNFLYGGKISWFELSLHQDVDRNKTQPLREQVEHDLEEHLASQINLYHRPGAGGTTVARRIAWELHRTYPIVLLHKASSGTIERLRLLRSETSCPILVVVESADVPPDFLEDLYSTVRSENLPIVLLLVSRRFETVRQEEERVRYLREQLDSDEADRFAEVYGRERSDRLTRLRDLAQNEEKQKLRVPFYFGLIAFDKDFTQLDTYVEARLEGMSETEQRIMCYLALAYRYGQQTLPAQMFAHILGLESAKAVRLDQALDERRQSLLIRETREGETIWRPSHQLVAVEICEQILAGDAADRRMWRENLSAWAIRFIEDCDALYETTSRPPSERILDLLKRLFVLRDSRDVLGTAIDRPNFARLLEDIPIPEGRLAILQSLVNHFDDQSHFWAHLSRYQSFQGEHSEALRAIECALELDEKDHVLHHMKGMALRTKAYGLMGETEKKARSGEAVPDETLEEIENLLQQAEDAFIATREMAPDDQHAHISHIQLLTRAVEFGFKMSGEKNYTDFLTNPTTLKYQEEVELAEELLGDVKRLRAGERQVRSRFIISCEALLNKVVGDYTQVIKGWT